MRETTVNQWVPVQQGLTMKITVQVSGNENLPIDQKFLPMIRVRYLEGYLFFKDGFRVSTILIRQNDCYLILL